VRTALTVLLTVAVVVLGALAYKELAIGDTAGLARLRADPVLVPAPGSTELGRLEDARRPSIFFVDHDGIVETYAASPLSADALRDFYVRSFGLSLQPARQGGAMALEGGFDHRITVLIGSTFPPSARRAGLRSAPPGTRSRITVIVTPRN
jgi:hypothetical protein